MASVAFYISGHGYGHATRQAALMSAVRARRPDLRLVARTDAPAWLFPEGVETAAKAVDVGMAQFDALRVDFAESARRHEALAARWEEEVAAEAAFLARERAAVVVCDASPLGCAAAARAGVPSFVVSNFLWDWILEDYAAQEPRLAPVAELYRAAYDSARELLKLPMSGGFEGRARVSEAPLLCRRSPRTRAQARALLGLESDRPAVLVTFGGVGAAFPQAGPGLSKYRFFGWGPAPRGLEASWKRLPEGRAGGGVDALAACDVALTKLGYGMVSESAIHGSRLLWVPRSPFAETPFVRAYLERHGTSAELSYEDFQAGRWASALEALLARPWTGEPVSPDGDRFVADRLISVI